MSVRRVEHDITTLVLAQKDFYRDRPNLAQHNNQLAKVTDLLSREIAELNGHAADGMTVEKYREQEIADIVWFSMGMLKQLGVYPSDAFLHGVAAELGVRPPEQWSGVPQPFDTDREERYWHIKTLLEEEAEKLNAPDFQDIESMWELTGNQRRRLLEHLHRIMGLTWTLFFLLEVNPYTAVMEKMARNHAKHQAKFYTKPGGTYEEGKAEANKAWERKTKTGKVISFNQEFYADDVPLIPPSEEKREIGAGYQSVARAIASLYGALARIPWPRNRHR